MKNGETDVTDNYEIEYVNGTLTITKSTKFFKIESKPYSWEYDGSSHSWTQYVVTYGDTVYNGEPNQTEFTLSTGDKLTITNTANTLGIYLVFEISFSRFTFDIKTLKTINVKAKPIQYNTILKTA